MKNRAWTGPALVALALCLVIGVMWVLVDQNRQLKRALTSQAPPPSEVIKAGDAMPDIALTDTVGKSARLQQLAAGKVVVLGLLTTTCRYCSENLTPWTELYEAMRRRGIQFHGVSLNGAAATQSYVDSKAVTWPVWTVDPTEISKFPPTPVPATIVMDSHLRVRLVEMGVMRDVPEFIQRVVSLEPSPPE